MIRRILESLLVTTAALAWIAAVGAGIAVFAVHALDAVPPFALLRIEGAIEGTEGTFEGGTPGLFAALGALERVERSADARALVLRIDSPGGTPAASDELHEAIRRVRAAGKTVVVSAGDLCASGGYYAACAAERIVANASTVTGSIGVISQFPVVETAAARLGVEMQTVKSAEFKDIGSMYRLPTGPERAHLQSVVDEMHRRFVAVVAGARRRATAEIEAVADGRYFTGARALELGLVDRLGGLREAVEEARALAGLPADAEPVELEPDTGFVRSLVTASLRSLAGGFLAAPGRIRPRL